MLPQIQLARTEFVCGIIGQWESTSRIYSMCNTVPTVLSVKFGRNRQVQIIRLQNWVSWTNTREDHDQGTQQQVESIVVCTILYWLLLKLCRYGRVQSVKLLPRAKDDEGSGVCATVSFMDIKSASKAHNNEQKLEERVLSTEYHEPAAIPGSGPPLYSQRFSHGLV